MKHAKTHKWLLETLLPLAEGEDESAETWELTAAFETQERAEFGLHEARTMRSMPFRGIRIREVK
jgi:hypothetical protein